MTADRIECFGGPQDGETVKDKGLFWRCVGIVEKETDEVRPGTSGTYTRERDGYHWRPDPA